MQSNTTSKFAGGESSATFLLHCLKISLRFMAQFYGHICLAAILMYLLKKTQDIFNNQVLYVLVQHIQKRKYRLNSNY